MSKTKVIFTLASVLAVIILILLLYRSYQEQEKLKIATATELALQSGKYEREINVLRRTAEDLKWEVEKAKATSGGGIRYITRYKDRVVTKEVTSTVELPADCITCLSSIEIPYHFETSYVVLNDVLRFDKDSLTFKSINRDFQLTDEFKEKLLKIGIENFVKEDEKIFQARWGAMIDYGWSDATEPLPGLGLGVSLEFMNLKKWVGFEAGMNVAFVAVPQTIEESHIFLGMDWRFVRNAAIGLGYARSIGSNMVQAELIFFPFD